MWTKLGIAVSALVAGFLFFRWYLMTGANYLPLPFPSITVALFGLHGDRAEGAAILELLAWCIAVTEAIAFTAYWAIKRDRRD